MTAALPAIAAGVSVASGVIGLGASLAGTAADTSAAMAIADYRTEVAKRNAKLSSDNAYRAIDRGQVEQFNQDLKTRALEGDQIAVQAGSGLDLNSGSFIRTRRTAAMLGRLDALNVRQASSIEAYNYRTQSEDYTKEAEFEQANRGNAAIQGMFTGLGQVAAGVGGISNSLATMNALSSWAVRSGSSIAGGAL